jgi:hypothetical protein
MTVDCRVKFAPTYSEKKPLVFEFDESVLTQVLDGEAFVKFDEHGIGNLCTKSDTYKIRHVDNSNTQLVVDEERLIITCSTPGVVQIDRIILDSVPEADMRKVFDTYRDHPNILPYLTACTIWSETKIFEFLNTSIFTYIDDSGRWRMLDESEYFDLTQLVLNACAIVGKCPESDNYNSEEVWLQLNEFLRDSDEPESSLVLVQYLMSRLSDSPHHKNKGGKPWPLNIPIDTTQLVLSQARYVLYKKRHIPISRFFTEVKELLSRTPSVDSAWVDDERLVPILPDILDSVGFQDGVQIMWFPTRMLPVELEQRVEKCFSARSVWPKEELERLVSPLLPESMKTETALMKSGCRLETADDEEDERPPRMVYTYRSR